jgi:branched-chain amino acid transport system ATP-binding protein
MAISPSPTPASAAPDHTDRIVAAGVTVHFGGLIALQDVSLSVPSGQVRGLIGPNGAGKTTLFDVISGFRQPAAGQVWMDGEEITRRTAMQRARLGMRRTFQRQQVFSWLSVEDNVLTALEWEGGGGGILADLLGAPSRTRIERTRRDRARDLIEMCGLGGLERIAVGSLPIGKARLVELARALVSEPKVLLLDEPTSGLSPEECRQVARIVSDYRERSHSTVILVEHDLEFVMGLSDAVSVLEAGRVIFDGGPQEARRDPDVKRAYLG